MWIRTRTQFVNVAGAVRAEPQPLTIRGDRPTRFVDIAGREIAVVADTLDMERLAAPVIPGSGEVAVFVDAAGEVTCLPIVGYRVMPAGAEPVLAGPRPSGVMFAITCGGAVVGCEEPFRRLYSSIPDAVAAVAAASAPTPATPAASVAA